jgi:RNA polymerase sigma-70 factor (ECF subfamily)
VTRPRTPPDHDGLDEVELVRAIAAGGSAALVTFFRNRRAEVYRFALNLTGSPTTAEDVTQDVFLTVIRDAARYDASRGAPIAWLLGITRNLVRRRAVRDRLLLPLGDGVRAELLVRRAADPSVAFDREQETAALRRAVMALPLRYREVVLLCDLQELTYRDAAAALGCAVGTVRSRLHRARAMLAKKLRKAAHARRPVIAVT